MGDTNKLSSGTVAQVCGPSVQFDRPHLLVFFLLNYCKSSLPVSLV